MKVESLMTHDVVSCSPQDSLAHAAYLMMQRDCGCVPVVDDENKLVGILTDRDVCFGAYRASTPLNEINVASVMTRGVHACHPHDAIGDAEMIMRQYQVRRVPVVDELHRLVGILSVRDIALEAQNDTGRMRRDVTRAEVAQTVIAICEDSMTHSEHKGEPVGFHWSV